MYFQKMQFQGVFSPFLQRSLVNYKFFTNIFYFRIKLKYNITHSNGTSISSKSKLFLVTVTSTFLTKSTLIHCYLILFIGWSRNLCIKPEPNFMEKYSYFNTSTKICKQQITYRLDHKKCPNIFSTWCTRQPVAQLWQYGLQSFQMGDSKLEIFLPKNQHT